MAECECWVGDMEPCEHQIAAESDRRFRTTLILAAQRDDAQVDLERLRSAVLTYFRETGSFIPTALGDLLFVRAAALGGSDCG